MADPAEFGGEVEEEAARLLHRLGSPDLGVVLGSGFTPLLAALGASASVGAAEMAGFPVVAPERGREIAAATVEGGRLWVLVGRRHLYEGCRASAVAFPVAVLAAAGARSLLLTCAAGGLRDRDRVGDLVVVTDHLNLTGSDPLRLVDPRRRHPMFLDLQGAYDPVFQEVWRSAARRHGTTMRDGVLAGVPGPCYETPAEVRMLRAMGADLASMSTVPETIAARYLGLRVAAVACVANLGAGMSDADGIEHGRVLAAVEAAVTANVAMLVSGLAAMCAVERRS